VLNTAAEHWAVNPNWREGISGSLNARNFMKEPEISTGLNIQLGIT
jgi:hypothetical protein